MVEGVVGGGVGGERGGGGVAVGLGVGRRDRHQDGQRQKGLWWKREGLRVGGKRGGTGRGGKGSLAVAGRSGKLS